MTAQRAGIASGKLGSSPAAPRLRQWWHRSSGQGPTTLQKGPLGLWAPKSWKDVVFFGKRSDAEMVFLTPPALLFFQETGDRRIEVSIWLKKKKTNWNSYTKAEPFSFVLCVPGSKTVQETSQTLPDLEGNPKCNLHQLTLKFDLHVLLKSSPIWRSFTKWKQTHRLPVGDTRSLK